MAAQNTQTKNWKLHILIVLVGIFLDQSTKLWAVKTFTAPSGEVNYQHKVEVIGEYVQFRLVYNKNAAFGIAIQKSVPFLNPTVFYSIMYAVAITVLFMFYRKVPHEETYTQLGICSILAGAFGNLIDRFVRGQVVDFIDAEFPDIFRLERWPTFNVADSLVCIGVGCILIMGFFQKKTGPPMESGSKQK